MVMKNQLIEIEKIFDAQIPTLEIFKLSFQSIHSILLFTAENIDSKGEFDKAMDYVSRISLIYPSIKKYAQNIPLENSTQSILRTGKKEYLEDINFLNAYAHFCLLMPQIHRGTLEVKSIEEKKIKIDYANESVKESELIDKLYSTISLPISFSFKDSEKVKEYTDSKAQKREFKFNGADFVYIKQIYEFHLKISINIEVLTDEVASAHIGFSNIDFRRFISCLKAFSDYFILLARSYKEKVNENNLNEDNEKLMSEYMEWSTCCLNYKTIGWFIGMSELSADTFYNILSYFIDIYSNNTGQNFLSKAATGEGYQPPITLLEDSILFSPHSLRYLLSYNNILYSINKNEKKLFDEKISSHLEPVLINQVEYLFEPFKNIECKKNVNFEGSEIDLLVLSKEEKICLSFQIKATISPDSSRSVARVQDRTIEALNQINIFQDTGKKYQLELINNTFGTNLDEIKILNFILVRSCAGSEKSWEINKTYRILNYVLLARLLCEKLNSSDFGFKYFDKEILVKQNELIEISKWDTSYENLKIGDYEIEFPNIDFNDISILSQNLKIFKCYPKMEIAHP